MFPGWWQLLLVVLLAVLLFGGRGKISELMGDVAKGIRSFQKGLSDDDQTSTSQQREVEDSAEQDAHESRDETRTP